MTWKQLLLFITLVLFIIAFVCSLPAPGTWLTLTAQSWALAAFIAWLLSILAPARRIGSAPPPTS